jgi:hypothetical protein
MAQKQTLAHWIKERAPQYGAKLGRGGWRLRDGTMLPGLHPRLDEVLPKDRRVPRVAGTARRVSGKQAGLAVHHALRRAINDRRPIPAAQREARAVMQWLNRSGLQAVAAEIGVYDRELGAATGIDVLCHCPRTDRAVVVEVKTTRQTADQHKRTYTRTVRGAADIQLGTGATLPNSEAMRHRLQVTATVRMLSSTFGVDASRIDAWVVMAAADARSTLSGPKGVAAYHVEIDQACMTALPRMLAVYAAAPARV